MEEIIYHASCLYEKYDNWMTRDDIFSENDGLYRILKMNNPDLDDKMIKSLMLSLIMTIYFV